MAAAATGGRMGSSRGGCGEHDRRNSHLYGPVINLHRARFARDAYTMMPAGVWKVWHARSSNQSGCHQVLRLLGDAKVPLVGAHCSGQLRVLPPEAVP